MLPDDDELAPGETDEAVTDGAEDEGDAGSAQSGADTGDDLAADAEGDDGGATDDGPDDDAGEDEGQAGEPAQVTGAAKPLSRATRAVLEAKRVAKEAKAEAEAAKAEIAAIRAERQRTQSAADIAAEAARLEAMPPEEKFNYLLQKQEQRFQSAVGGLQFQMQDSADRIAFDSLCARNDDVGKAYALVRDDVESRLAQMRQQGATAPRETIAKYFLGERAINRAAAAKSRQGKKGAANIQRQTARPGAARSDVGRSGERSGSEAQKRAQRLSNLQI